MGKKIVAVLMAIAFLLSPCGINVASAALDPVAGTSRAISAFGTLTTTSQFSVNILGGSGLSFACDIPGGDSPVCTADEVVEVLFNYSLPNYQVIVISTNNRENATHPYTGEGTGAGLVHSGSPDVAAPLSWAVFDTQAQAQAYNFVGNDVVEAYVVDRRQDEVGASWTGAIPTAWEYYDATEQTYPVIGYATVLGGITGQEASLGAFPAANRTIDDGSAYVALGCNYNGQPSTGVGEQYVSESLTLEMLTIS